MQLRGKKWTTDRILEKIGNRKISSLTLYNTSADDRLLIELSERRRLTSFEMTSDRITDAGVQAIIQSCPLKSLLLQDAPLVTDRTLEVVSDCPTLRELYLCNSAISDDGIGCVSSLPDLWSLLINETDVTDRGIAAIASNSIHLIHFSDCPITGTGFSTWAVTDKMSFYTDGSHLNDEGFAVACKAFPFLWSVIIENTNVTNSGIRALEGHRLTMLRIRGSKIDREGVLWIIENVPELQGLEVDPTQFSSAEAEAYRDHRGSYFRNRVY